MLEKILDSSRTHKCRGKQNPIFKRKQGLRTKAQNHISNLKGGKNISFCFERSILGNVQFSLRPSWEAVSCVLEDTVNDSKQKKNLFHVDKKTPALRYTFPSYSSCLPIRGTGKQRHPCHVYRPCLVICMMDRELRAVLPTLLIGKTWK